MGMENVPEQSETSETALTAWFKRMPIDDQKVISSRILNSNQIAGGVDALNDIKDQEVGRRVMGIFDGFLEKKKSGKYSDEQIIALSREATLDVARIWKEATKE